MVRDNDTIFAEPNDPDTVKIADDSYELINNGLVKGAGNKRVKRDNDTATYGSIIYLLDGVVQELAIQPSKRLGTDANGNLAWI